MAEEQHKKGTISSDNANVSYGSGTAGTGNKKYANKAGAGYEVLNADVYGNTGNTRGNKVDHNNRFSEETAAEIAAPVTHERRQTEEGGKAEAGTGIGVAALVLSIISLFVLPVLFAGAGIVLGLIARARGAWGLGSWAIGIGVVSLILALFINLVF